MRRAGWLPGLLVFAAANAQAQTRPDPIGELDEVIVTAPSRDGTLRTTPHGVTVITAADIQRSTAHTVGELLGREANLNLRSYFGGDGKATVDMRGMGEQAGSNVLVLVDGVRLNEVDLSGADLSSVPLAQIERIEIVRGGGAVRWGDGAVAGVINIITRGAARRRAIELQTTLGSFDSWEQRVVASGSLGPVSALLNLSARETGGWRDHSAVSARDALVDLRWALAAGPVSDVFLRASHHHDDTEYPGPLGWSDLQAGDAARQRASTPLNGSRTDDSRLTLGTHIEVGPGELALQASWRDRENPYYLGGPQRLGSQGQELQAHYDASFRAWGQTHTLRAGLERHDADYGRDELVAGMPGTYAQRLDGSMRNTGGFIEAGFTLSPAWSLQAGLRRDRFETQVRNRTQGEVSCTERTEMTWIDIGPPGTPILIWGPVQVRDCLYGLVETHRGGGTWNNEGAELGLTWRVAEQWTAFAGYARHFRSPNLDELMKAADDLRPQHGRTWEAGVRHAGGPRLEWSVTAFDMRIAEEIYYDAVQQINRNYESSTSRQGLELEGRWQALKVLALRGSLGYVHPRFDGQPGDIPLVPRYTAFAQLDWTLRPDWHGLFSARYVSERRNGSAYAESRFPDLPMYVVCDLALKGRWHGVQLAAGINNVFDRVYTTVAFASDVYPMPPRHAYLSATFSF